MIDLDAYFSRIGYTGPRAPTLDVLRALHALHPAAIPYDGIDVLLDKPVDLAPDALFDKLVVRRRGGYCFENNGLFKEVLRQLGFKVEAFLCRVLWFLQPGDPLPVRTHMTLQVTIDGEPWLADVGFGGGALTSPLLLNERGPQITGNGVYRISPEGNELKLELQSRERWLPMVLFPPAPQLDIDFIAPNWYTSTHPRSTFKHRLMACRTFPRIRHALLNNRYTVRQPNGDAEHRELDRSELERVLGAVFDIDVTPELQAAIDRVVWKMGAAAISKPDTKS